MYGNQATRRSGRALIRQAGQGIVIALALASAAMAEEPEVFTTGPGAVFDSPEAAAIDALMFAHRTMALARGRGGAIFVVDGGYSYGSTVRATARDGFQLTLRPGHVGWYYAHNNATPLVPSRQRELLSDSDRTMVSRVDPLHRPLYLLTPELKVIRFDGENVDLVWPKGKITIEDVIAAN